MKKIVGLIIALIGMSCFFSAVNGSNNRTNNSMNIFEWEKKYANVFLSIEDTSIIILRKSNDSLVLLRNHYDEDVFIQFSLIDKSIINGEKYYKVVAWNTESLMCIDSGYIHSSAPLKIFLRLYAAPFDTLNLYSEPNYCSSSIVDSIYIPHEIEVLDFSGKWLKVRVPIYNQEIEGWLSPDRQCVNVYSTCC